MVSVNHVSDRLTDIRSQSTKTDAEVNVQIVSVNNQSPASVERPISKYRGSHCKNKMVDVIFVIGIPIGKRAYYIETFIDVSVGDINVFAEVSVTSNE